MSKIEDRFWTSWISDCTRPRHFKQLRSILTFAERNGALSTNDAYLLRVRLDKREIDLEQMPIWRRAALRVRF